MCLGVGVMVICMLGGAGQNTCSVCVIYHSGPVGVTVDARLHKMSPDPHLGLHVVDADIHQLLLVSSLKDSVGEGSSSQHTQQP